ncbi:right-handed parallel beta-helix repeat-containing protein [Alkalimarinus alittae]|uniref:Right-handed parallel beta-helix repeat-containing protein n=1 Tax=Alkalimarinus alittae TaxID=2961619 RepID=A0ABY6N2N5_9ALTE|nr:right-handed parallel beta-helix repeat-containing protein [Alkalimarinus alittae]UZE96309.1 right-handed parallel beta-helix repeat-containing protein [Alkalimarinus alittae]
MDNLIDNAVKQRRSPLKKGYPWIMLILFYHVLGFSSAAHADALALSKQPTATHAVNEIPVSQFQWDSPSIPDSSAYNLEAIKAKIPANKKPVITIQRLVRSGPLKDFVRGKRLLEWAKRQLSSPKIIEVESGLATLEDIANAVDSQYFEKLPNGAYIARLPILVGNNATLLIDGSDSNTDSQNSESQKPQVTLLLSQDRGAFLVNDGLFFAINSRIVGWNEKNNTNAYYKEDTEFRPFFVSWGGSETYIADSAIESFGYFQSKSYGITFTQYKEHDNMHRAAPKGWIIDSEFYDTYYGFYCYEAEDVALVGNTYRDNILYGIDPHDRSSRLLIANNHVYGTREKHGIIISREVNDSWIVNNRTHDNHLSGIVLDRDSQRNVVANNTVYSNGGDGITLYESDNNHIINNVIADNTRQGIRVRNSNNTRISHNAIVKSGGYGIFAEVQDLSATDRDMSMDAYQTATTIWVTQDSLSENHSGPIFIGPKVIARLYNPSFISSSASKNLSLKGTLAAYQHKILDIIYRKKSAVIIEPIEYPHVNHSGS